MNREFLRLFGLQILGLGIVLSVIQFFIDNSLIVVLVGAAMVGTSYVIKK